MVLAAVSPSTYWFITRATGAVALVLLTVSVCLGIAEIRRSRPRGLPRFVIDSLHRSASLLAVVFLVVHIATTLLDGFAPISLLDSVTGFTSSYRSVWLGLGAVASDLMIAVTITSLVRQRLGYRTWRLIHWLAYASWPLALVHGYGTGTDTRAAWMLVLSGACVVATIAAVVARVNAGWPDHRPFRVSALGLAALVPVGLVAWMPSGPLAAGWARRAGTPASVLAKAHGSAAVAGGSSSSRTTSTPISVTARFTGTVRQQQLGPGPTLVDITLTVGDPRLRDVHIRIEGEPISGGGVQMTSSEVSAGPAANGHQYTGRVTALQGADIQATLSDRAGSTLVLLARLRLGAGGQAASGTLTARSGG
jgi:DMSO/TMAO reductase YedYZ heme-binding membrane subunit